MTKHTKRDAIWSAALKLGERGVFEVEHVLFAAGLTERSERTAKDVLVAMFDLGHLKRGRSFRSKKSHWRSPSLEKEEYTTPGGETRQRYPIIDD